MASPSGNSSGSPQVLNNSGSEEELQILLIDQRKRKRMESNRESARRSRMRKLQHLNDLMSQVTQLRKDNNQLMININITTQHLLSVEAENSILRAQMMELTQRLDSLNGILNLISHASDGISGINDGFMNPLMNNMVCFNQPIVASSDLFHEY